jgi:hypothetical protein
MDKVVPFHPSIGFEVSINFQDEEGAVLYF